MDFGQHIEELASDETGSIIGSRCFGTSVRDLIGENPEARGENPEIVRMYRELKDRTDDDRAAIQAMMDHLKKRKQ